MDFTLIKRTCENEFCYKLLKSNFYRNHYVIIAQSKTDFSCGSIKAKKETAIALFDEIAQGLTEPHTLSDILSDFNKERV